MALRIGACYACGSRRLVKTVRRRWFRRVRRILCRQCGVLQ